MGLAIANDRLASVAVRARLAAEEASRAKSVFLASMSHELRTPLTAVLGLSEALQEGVFEALNERQLNALRTIEESGRHLLHLITDILDFSKMEAGQLELDVGPTSVADVCESSVCLIKGLAMKKELRIGLEIDDPSTILQADSRRLVQILVNLLSNAVKFTPEGGQIGLRVTCTWGPDGEALRFTVWDTGIGIAPADLPRLFQPFVQLDGALSRGYQGSGLGLSLVRGMAERHGGHMEVSSEPGLGSQFTVVLPLRGANSGANGNANRD
jgi:signal transduction histidine kinase